LGGLVAFNALVEESGVTQVLRSVCAPLKTGRSVVYPMETQVRLLLDLFVVGGTRLFDLEYLASDPLFVHLAGGRLCCLDTLYSDVQRFHEEARDKLAALLAEQGLAALRGRLLTRLHVDVDTSVCPVFGDGIEGAVPGYNPQYHGRNSYHPILARIVYAKRQHLLALGPTVEDFLTELIHRCPLSGASTGAGCTPRWAEGVKPGVSKRSLFFKLSHDR
jgi:hypothetical protein